MTQNYGPNILVVQGDITQVPADAMITAINSGAMWYGGIDRAINCVAGNLYHYQAFKRMPLKNLDVIIASSEGKIHRGKFHDVIFVVDDLESPLRDIIYAGLETAHKQEYAHITIPTIRMGVMSGEIEKSNQETAMEMVLGVDSFVNKYGKHTSLKNASFVVYNDQATSDLLKSCFGVKIA